MTRYSSCGQSCSSAYYSGYSLELALKACIAKLVQPTPSDKAFVNAIYVHKLDSLLDLSGHGLDAGAG
jgi:hypothetical protein